MRCAISLPGGHVIVAHGATALNTPMSTNERALLRMAEGWYHGALRCLSGGVTF